MESLGVYYWYVKMLRCGYVEHGLEYFSFYLQKHIVHLAACSGPRRAARGARISETLYSPLAPNLIADSRLAPSQWETS